MSDYKEGDKVWVVYGHNGAEPIYNGDDTSLSPGEVAEITAKGNVVVIVQVVDVVSPERLAPRPE